MLSLLLAAPAAPIVNHGLPHAKLSPAADLNLVQAWIDVNNTDAMEASSAVNVCGVNCAWTTPAVNHMGRSHTCGARVTHRAWKSFGGDNTQACAAVAKNWPTICGGCDPEYVASPPPPAAPPAMSDHTTGCNEASGKENMYLDRHVVQCPVGSALSDFKFTNHGCSADQDWHYMYQCMMLEVTSTSEHETSCNEGNAGKLEYLDRHNVACPAGNVLTAFRYTVCGGGKFQYKYTCAVPKTALIHTDSKKTSCNEMQDKEIVYLDRHHLSCDAGSAMGSFKLEMGTPPGASVAGNCGSAKGDFAYECFSTMAFQ